MPERTSGLSESEWRDLQGWCTALHLPALPDVRATLGRYRDLLLDWNRRVNLTAITSARGILIKHFLDSLTVLPHLASQGPLLDVGSGAGFPGLVVKLARPGLPVTLVEARARKVAFLEEARRQLRLSGCDVLHRHLRPGDPELAGRFGTVVSRAFTAPGPFLRLGRQLLAPGGRVVVMLGGARPGEADPADAARATGATRVRTVAFALPEGGGERRLLVAEWDEQECFT